MFKSISTGGAHACSIKADDTLVCWGENRVSTGDFAEHTGQATPPSGTFRSVSAGGAHSCGVTTDNLVVCWGAGYDGTIAPPPGAFLSVSAGGGHGCAVRIDGIIACWGRDLGYRTLGLQTNVICGVLPNRATVCPGDENYDLLAALHASDWVHYYDHDGSAYPCGKGPDGVMVCWDPYEETFVGPTPRELAAFSADGDSACWLLPDGTVGCWGGFGSPVGTFQSVVVGEAVYRGFACGVRTNGELACWGGDGHDSGNVFPPEGTFKSVSPGHVHACAIKMDDTVVCWGSVGTYGRGVPSSGPFRSLYGGGSGSHCGIRPDDTLDCWGLSHALPGAFQSVSVQGFSANDYYCGVRTDGTVACSGTDYNSVTTPPEGKFQSVSLGWGHACGVRLDGTVACWGSNADYEGEVTGQATSPDGQFLSVSAGENYTCGIRTDHTLACWGRVPEVLQNLSGIEPPSSTEPKPTATPDIWFLPLRDQLDLEMEKPGNLVANVDGGVDRIYRFVG